MLDKEKKMRIDEADFNQWTQEYKKAVKKVK